MPSVLSIIESPSHPNFGDVFNDPNISNTSLGSMRKAIAKLKTFQPNYIIAEFFYGYGNNYAGINISNLDVLLYTLQKYSPETRMIVLVDKSERGYVDQLNNIFPLHSILQLPVQSKQIREIMINDEHN